MKYLRPNKIFTMFIEQLKNRNFNFILYLPVILGFFGLMASNFLFSQDVSTEDIMHSMIQQLGTNLTFVIMILPLSLMCLGLLFWVKVVHKQSIRSLTTARKKIDFSRVFFSFGIWTLISVVLTMVTYFASPEDFVLQFEFKPFISFFFLALVLVPLQTSFEEYFFRGYMMQGVGILTNSRLIPFILTSALFGLMHIANPEVGKMGYIVLVYYIGTGFFLGVLTLMDEGLELALGFHAANNLVGGLLVTADWTAFQTHSIFKDISKPAAGFDIVVPVFVLFPILLYLFSRRYGWTDWKGKLFGKLQTIDNSF